MQVFKFISSTTTLLMAGILLSLNASAHLMVSQQGTINVVGAEAFVVISIPISTFKGIDTNQDGHISMIEFNQHRNTVTQQLVQNFVLLDKDQSIELVDVLLSPVQPHHSTDQHFTQLTVMGKFKLDDLSESIKLKINLYGTAEDEQRLKVTLIRAEDHIEQTMQFNPTSTISDVLLTQSTQ